MHKRLLDILCCPASKMPVTPMGKAQLETLNNAIALGNIRNLIGGIVEQPLQAGLITVDGKRIYRIEDDIPVMLSDEAIIVSQIDAFPSGG